MKLYWKSSSKSKTGFKLIFLHYPAPQVPDNPACPLEQIPRYLEKLDLWQLRTVYFSSIPSTSKSTKRTEQVCPVRDPLKIWPQISFPTQSQGFGSKWTHSRFLARQPLVVMKIASFMSKLTRVNTCETSKHFHFTRILVLDPNGIFSLYFLMFSTFKFLNVTNTTLVKAPNALQWFVLLVLLISLTLKSTIGDSVPPNFVLSPFHLIQC